MTARSFGGAFLFFWGAAREALLRAAAVARVARHCVWRCCERRRWRIDSRIFHRKALHREKIVKNADYSRFFHENRLFGEKYVKTVFYLPNMVPYMALFNLAYKYRISNGMLSVS